MKLAQASSAAVSSNSNFTLMQLITPPIKYKNDNYGWAVATTDKYSIVGDPNIGIFYNLFITFFE